MGGTDKGLVPLSGRPLVAWVIQALAPQVGAVIINANRNREIYAAYGYPVIADEIEGFQGPLAGFASAMKAVTTPWIATVPCDGPYPAPDLVERLCRTIDEQKAEIAVATDGRRLQPVYALVPVALAASLHRFLDSGERKIDRWYAGHRTALADLSDRPECFVNVNSAEDSRELERKLHT
jgi:molybdenum cofactor guanylyltransferase